MDATDSQTRTYPGHSRAWEILALLVGILLLLTAGFAAV